MDYGIALEEEPAQDAYNLSAFLERSLIRRRFEEVQCT